MTAGRSIYGLVCDPEDDIGATESIGQILAALVGSANEMPCSALAPLANSLLAHAGSLEAKFKELHRLTVEDRR